MSVNPYRLMCCRYTYSDSIWFYRISWSTRLKVDVFCNLSTRIVL